MAMDFATNTPEDAARFEQQQGPLYPDGRKSCADGRRCDNEPDYPDAGYAATALVLFVCIAGSLLFLFVLMVGRQAMCETHANSLSYCPGFADTHHSEQR